MPAAPRRPRLLVLLLFGAAGVAAACARPSAPARPPDLVGVVAEVGPLGRPATVRVGDVRVPAAGYEAGVALDLGRAPIFVRRPGGALARGGPADVAVGAAVRAWSTGVERRSRPPQWDATWIEVTPAPGR